MELNKALQALIKAKIIGYLKKELIKRTVLAGLLTILSPTALLQFGSIIDNAWGNTRALAIKARDPHSCRMMLFSQSFGRPAQC
jgi:hypothetical protein